MASAVTNETKQRAVNLYKDGGSLKNVASEVKVSEKTLKGILAEAGVAVRSRGRPRGNNPVRGEVTPIPDPEVDDMVDEDDEMDEPEPVTNLFRV